MNNHQLTLIDSTYAPKDAKEVLISLFQDKINFLNRKIFSLQERFGSDTKHLESRVQELKADIARLHELINGLKNDQHLLEINCSVDITVREAALS